MKITYRYALNLSVILLSAKGTGWEYEETFPAWWGIKLYLSRN